MPITPAELDAPVLQALRLLGATATAVLNQSVLLAGVNDDAATLAELSRRLFDGGVLPYYLHQLDQVTGAAHFCSGRRTGHPAARNADRHPCPATWCPRLVRELPGASGKTPIFNGTSGDPLKA